MPGCLRAAAPALTEGCIGATILHVIRIMRTFAHNFRMVSFVTLICLCAMSSAHAVPVVRARYDVILAQMPFGTPPPPKPKRAAPAPIKPPPAELNFAKFMRVCFMRSTPDGLLVGITDKKTKKSMVLEIGETKEDVLLVDAVYDKGAALIQKGEVKQWISTDGNTPDLPTSGRRTAPQAATSGTASTGYADIVKRRNAALAARRRSPMPRRPNTSGLTGEALQKKLREYNEQLIRAGGAMGPALPIQLTPEQDAKLVREGVLPPQ